jgi:hypothetical protein
MQNANGKCKKNFKEEEAYVQGKEWPYATPRYPSALTYWLVVPD